MAETGHRSKRTKKNSVDTTIGEITAYYRERAPWHDEYMNYDSNAAMEELLGPIIRTLENYVTGKRVLEIACGTGNWTQVLSRRAQAVYATDVNKTVLDIARGKDYKNDNVVFEKADAYDLGSIDGTYEAALAADWWSHMPRSVIPSFLESLNTRLIPAAPVIIIDMLNREEFEKIPYRLDDEGNRINRRTLPHGKEFEVIRNFPDRVELFAALADYATNIKYFLFDNLKRWMVIYRARKRLV